MHCPPDSKHLYELFQFLLGLSVQKAAIKKMDMQASREFLAELKVLTHVHHLNLVISFIFPVNMCFVKVLCFLYWGTYWNNLSCLLFFSWFCWKLLSTSMARNQCDYYSIHMTRNDLSSSVSVQFRLILNVGKSCLCSLSLATRERERDQTILFIWGCSLLVCKYVKWWIITSFW